MLKMLRVVLFVLRQLHRNWAHQPLHELKQIVSEVLIHQIRNLKRRLRMAIKLAMPAYLVCSLFMPEDVRSTLLRIHPNEFVGLVIANRADMFELVDNLEE